jgi:hypothetical protein
MFVPHLVFSLAVPVVTSIYDDRGITDLDDPADLDDP